MAAVALHHPPSTKWGDRYAHSNWHYVNFFWEQRFPGGPVIPRPDKPLDGHLLNQLPGLAATVGNAQAGDSARSVALAWVLHLVGDAHQPLHNSARITPQDPQGDRGGNLFLLAGMYRAELTPLDALVGFASRAPVTRRAATLPLAAGWRGATRPVCRGRMLPSGSSSGRAGGRARRADGLPRLAGARPPARRVPDRRGTAAQPRLALAGYRIAELLNRMPGA